MNLIEVLFAFNTIFVGLIGFLIVQLEPHLPTILTRTYRYGKFADKSNHWLAIKFEVPKRWFRHFYIFSSPMATLLLILMLNKYLLNGHIPEFVYAFLDFFMGPRRKPLVSPEVAVLALVLMTIQCTKRLYETQVISIFSNSKMNVCHYIVGFCHYFGALISIVGESSGFVKGTHKVFDASKLTYFQYFFAVVFLWATYKQFKSNLILANLRKDEKGVVVTKSYKIPKGDLFDYVSSPLQFTECLLYFSLSMILLSSSTFHFITCWVFANQISCASLAQIWYHATFRNYPKSRKMIVPFLI